MRVKDIHDRNLPQRLREAIDREIRKRPALAGAEKAAHLAAAEETEKVLRKLKHKQQTRILIDRMWAILKAANLDALFREEYQFEPGRKWALDLYCDAHRVAIEIHGGVSPRHNTGRHTRGYGFINDRIKMNTATSRGIAVIEVTSSMMKDGTALRQVQETIAQRLK